MKPQKCQIQGLECISEGHAELGPQPLGFRLKLALARRLSPRERKAIKMHLNNLINWFSKFTGGSKTSPLPVAHTTSTGLKAGDVVRVWSREEIQATLNHWNELKGCAFLEDMWQYCGTVQRVLKPLEKFMDERDFRMKKCKGVVLLEGLICQGTPEIGRCDRSCFYFWREEWMEKI